MKKLAYCLFILILSQGLVIAQTKYEAEWQGVITARNNLIFLELFIIYLGEEGQPVSF